MAHERLLPFIPHCVPSALWRVDRDHVGLYGGGWDDHVHHSLHDGHGYWKPCGTSSSFIVETLVHLFELSIAEPAQGINELSV